MANVITDPEPGLINADDVKKIREIDFVRRFEHTSISKLLEVIGVTRKIPMMEGTTLYVYKVTGTLESGSVTEGEIIPLSNYEVTKTAVGTIGLKKWRKATSAEAIKKSGYNAAVRDTDTALLRDVQKDFRNTFFSFLNGTIDDSTTAAGVDLQSALANAWGQLQVKFEDDAVEPIYFVNPLDMSKYLGAAPITTQTAFGMNYIEDFLGLGTVVMSSRVSAGTFVATAKQNLILYYLTMSGDVARAFDLTTGDLDFIGISSGDANKERAQVESLVMSGITILVEYAEGVVKGSIDNAMPALTVVSAAGASSGKTAITVSGYTLGTGDSYKYKVTDDEIVVRKNDSTASGWSSWNGSADITAASNKHIAIVVSNSNKVVAAGETVVTAAT